MQEKFYFYMLKRDGTTEWAVAGQHSSHRLASGLLQVPTPIYTPDVTSKVTPMLSDPAEGLIS